MVDVHVDERARPATTATTSFRIFMPATRSSRTTASSIGEPGRVRMDGTRAEPSEPPARPAASSYERYKQQLHSFFNGDKPLPDSLRDMLATRPGATQHGFEEGEVDAATAAAIAAQTPAKPAKAKKSSVTRTNRATAATDDDNGRRLVGSTVGADDLILIEAIRRASSPREVQSSVDALLARGLALPKDADVLGKALGHADDGVLEQALGGLRDLILEGTFKGNPTLLKTRLKNVALMSSSSSVRELCTDVSARL